MRRSAISWKVTSKRTCIQRSTGKGPYLISLCDAAQNSGFSFGAASRLDTQSSTFSVDAAKLIHSIVTFSPASESVAIPVELLQEFQKASGMKYLGSVPLICKHSSLG
jgi:hypothetical protein